VPRNEAVVRLPSGAIALFVENANGSFRSASAGSTDLLTKNQDGSFDFWPDGGRSRYRYGAEGRLEQLADENGNALTFTHDMGGRVERISDTTSGRYIDVFYGPDGRISGLRDISGAQVGYTYAGGYLDTVTDAEGRETNYVYTAGRHGGLLSRISDGWGRVITDVAYDSADRVISYTEEGEAYTLTYGVAYATPQSGTWENTTRKVDSRGNTWIARFNAAGQVTDRVLPTGTIQKAFDSSGRVTESVDAHGVRTGYAYDAAGRLTWTASPLPLNGFSVQREYTYDPLFPDQVASVTLKDPWGVDPNWQSTRYDYHQAGSPKPGALFHVYRVRADGSPEVVATYHYDAQGRTTSQSNAGGASMTYTYDAQGNLWKVSAPPNNDTGSRPETTYLYDPIGRVLSTTDPVGRTTSYTYDDVGRVLTTSLPKPAANSALDFTTAYSYDEFDGATGLVFTRIMDPNGRVTRLGYDQFGRLVRAVDALGSATAYSYSGGQLASITDANGNVTSYSYTAERLSSTTFPDGAYESYTYYPDGQLFTRTDRRGRVATFTYDVHKRTTNVTHKTGGTVTDSVTYVYQGQKLASVNRTAPYAESTTFTYDSSYRVRTESQGGRGALTYDYTAGDQVLSVAIANGPTATYSYHDDGSLRTIDWSVVTGSFRYGYDLGGQYQRVTLPNGQVRDYSYDDQGRLTVLSNTLGATTLASFAYGYDVNPSTGQPDVLGQRTNMSVTMPALSLASASSSYGYDPTYQLTNAGYSTQPPFGGRSDSWGYDAIGNRITSTINETSRAYTYLKNGSNPSNGQRLQSDGVNSYGYDSAGNLVSKSGPGGAVGFGYDSDGRLTTSPTATYRYDYQGRRSTKTASGATATYLYEGQNLVSETRAGSRTYYLFGPGIDEPLAMAADGEVSYFSADGLGTIVATSSIAGAVTHASAFDAWGSELGSTGTKTHPFTYTGRETDEGGLLYYRARYYDPSIGRFTQEDPIGLRDGPNQYNYVRGNPVSRIDPLGLCCTVVDRTRDLLLALSIAAQTQDRTFWSQCMSLSGIKRMAGGGGGCGYNADGLVEKLRGKLSCWDAERVDAGPKWMSSMFRYSRVLPHSYVQLNPKDACPECPPPPPIALDNYPGWPVMAPITDDWPPI
jgi:RHS repeat-associated protein